MSIQLPVLRGGVADIGARVGLRLRRCHERRDWELFDRVNDTMLTSGELGRASVRGRFEALSLRLLMVWLSALPRFSRLREDEGGVAVKRRRVLRDRLRCVRGENFRRERAGHKNKKQVLKRVLNVPQGFKDPVQMLISINLTLENEWVRYKPSFIAKLN